MIFQSLVLCFVQLLITLSRSFIFPYTHVASLLWQRSRFLHYLQIFLLYSIFIYLRPQTNSMNKRNKSKLSSHLCNSLLLPSAYTKILRSLCWSHFLIQSDMSPVDHTANTIQTFYVFVAATKPSWNLCNSYLQLPLARSLCLCLKIKTSDY